MVARVARVAKKKNTRFRIYFIFPDFSSLYVSRENIFIM